MPSDAEVLDIGAGPIALIKIWGMKKLNPHLKVVILERYKQYERKNALILDWQELQAIMVAAHAEDEPVLIKLVEQLKEDPHIATNEIQKIFTDLVSKFPGVEIINNHRVLPDTIKDMIRKDYPKVKFIGGTDGTKGVVSTSLIAADNNEKYELDFVLQLRFDILGEEKPDQVNVIQLYHQMARMGMIAQEDIGRFENGKTAVTLRLFISKNDYLTLRDYNAQNPLKPFASNQAPDAKKLPEAIQRFVTAYLTRRIHANRTQRIDESSVIISVNETPVTHAKQIIARFDEARVCLFGDAALGLSYRKGFKAGLKGVAKFLTVMEPAIKDSFKNTALMDELLGVYQNWFINKFAPKQIKENEDISFWRIKAGMTTMKVAHNLKSVSHGAGELTDLHHELSDYFNHYVNDPSVLEKGQQWQPYPHRKYEPVLLGELGYVAPEHNRERLGKLFADYLKPYKSLEQFKQDCKQPLVGANNFGVGGIKILRGVFSLNGKGTVDGFSTLGRGTVEIFTSVLLPAKLATRGVTTLINKGYKKIEKNEGMQRIAQQGVARLRTIEDTQLAMDHGTAHEMLAFCNDLHRKFNKAVKRKQPSDIVIAEQARYSEVRKSPELSRENLLKYFSLFAQPPEKPKEPELPKDKQRLSISL